MLGKQKYFHILCHVLVGTLLIIHVKGTALADEASSKEIFTRLKQYTDLKQYVEAIQFLKSTAFENAGNPFFYYNLGILYHNSGQSGVALAYLEKAHFLLSNDLEINLALKTAKTTFSKLVGGNAKLDPASNWIEKLTQVLSLDFIVFSLWCLVVVLLFFLIRCHIKQRIPKIVFYHPLTFITLFCIAMTFGTKWLWSEAKATQEAMCIEIQTIKSGPGEEYSDLIKIEPGIKLRILKEKKNNWVQVRFTANEIGWIPSSSLLLFSPG
ncbi:MAG: hypothetical protein HY843_05075 [Bdellovibrio sp.]|nr:hypothetical protein [Bdellovibrio sp.]